MLKYVGREIFFVEELFEKLKISPKNLTLYNTAVSHSSYANEHKAKRL